MNYNVGDFVSFFSLNEEFEHLNKNRIDSFVEDCGWYEVKEFFGDSVIKVSNPRTDEDILADVKDYQIFTKQQLKEHLNGLNNKHVAICNKIKQLYRKHNNSGSNFKFQGV